MSIEFANSDSITCGPLSNSFGDIWISPRFSENIWFLQSHYWYGMAYIWEERHPDTVMLGVGSTGPTILPRLPQL